MLNRFDNRLIEYSELPKDELYQPEKIEWMRSEVKRKHRRNVEIDHFISDFNGFSRF